MDGSKSIPLHILVVDDDHVNRRMMDVMLSSQGHALEFASNGIEALEAVKDRKFDIVFMDLQMPVMDGIESSRLIREWERGNGYSTFIVALTASYLPEKGQELFDAGIDNYIAKPFKVDQIFRMLSYCISGSLQESSQNPVPHGGGTDAIEVLDVQAGLQRLGGNMNMYTVLLTDFMGGLSERLELLQQCLKSGDFHGLSMAAHNLKGVSASLGVLQLSEYAKKLESQCNGGYTSSALESLEEIRTSVDRFRRVGQDFLSNNSLPSDQKSI